MDRKTLRQIKKYKAIYLMMIPVLFYFLIFSYYPLLLGLIESFQKNKLIGSPEFVGIANYHEIISDYQFTQAAVNSLIIGAGTQIFTFTGSLVLAPIAKDRRIEEALPNDGMAVS